MHILWLTSWFPHKNNALFGNFVERQAKAVSQYANISLLNAVQHIDNEYVVEIVEGNPFLIRVYFPQTNNTILKMLRYLKAWRMGYKILLKSKGKPQFMHLHIMYPAGIFALILHFFYNIPFVLTEHWTGYATQPPKPISFFQKLIIKKCLNVSTCVAAYTTHYGKALARFGSFKKVAIIPNVVDTDFFIPPQYLKPKLTTFRLIHVSTCTDKQKNVSGIIRSLVALKKAHYAFELCIIGGSDREHKPLKKLAQSLDLEGIICFKPTMPHADLIGYLQQAHIFVLFSNYEGLPCVLLEAMSVGLPVVCTDTGGLEDWITPDNGRMIPIGDERALSHALMEMIDNYAQFKVSKIREMVVQTCGMTAVGEANVAMYKL